MPVWEEDIGGLRAAVRAGVVASALVTLGVGVYFLLTLDQPDRGLLLAVDFVVGVLACAVWFVPLERLARRGLIDAFFLVWSAVIIALAAGAVAVEDDPASPLVAAFFLPLIFAAAAYPLRLVVLVTALDLTAVVLTLVVGLERSFADVFLYGVIMVGAALLCFFQARAHERHLAEVARLSRTDHLTGTLNRRGFEEELLKRLARFYRYGTRLGLVLIDLDGFKRINDERGHVAGDALLKAVSAALVSAVRGTDAVARVGGDEFAVLLEQSDGVTAPLVAERVLEAIEGHIPASAGWACCPGDTDGADGLYRCADARLYERKGQRTVMR